MKSVEREGQGWALVRRTFRRGAQSNGHPSGKGKPQVRPVRRAQYPSL